MVHDGKMDWRRRDFGRCGCFGMRHALASAFDQMSSCSVSSLYWLPASCSPVDDGLELEPHALFAMRFSLGCCACFLSEPVSPFCPITW